MNFNMWGVFALLGKWFVDDVLGWRKKRRERRRAKIVQRIRRDIAARDGDAVSRRVGGMLDKYSVHSRK